jgi:hypothetical protein
MFKLLQKNAYPPELAVMKRLIKLLDVMGHLAIHYPNSPYFIRGFPDLIVLTKDSGVLLFEIKTPDGALTPHQKVFFGMLLQRLGIRVHVEVMPQIGPKAIQATARLLADRIDATIRSAQKEE